jgi:thiosulfate reductase cytochrome b subunit
MEKIYINPLPVRIWHWVNALGFLLLIATGLQLRYMDVAQVISFRQAVTLHNWTGFAMIANFVVWLGFVLFTDKVKGYRPETNLKKFSDASWKQMQYYGYGIFRGDPNPHHPAPDNRFNAMQSGMYQLIMILLLPLLFCTGLMMWDVTLFGPVVERLGGLRVVDTIHVLLFVFFSGFLIVHIYLCSLGHTRIAHFKAMVTGYEEVEENAHH